jgi:hypothetical protein
MQMLNPGSSPAVEVLSSRAAQDTGSVIFYTCPVCWGVDPNQRGFLLIGS